MKAKSIFEKFSEDSDPIKDMGIGMTFARRLEWIKKELKKFNIITQWAPDRNLGKGYYYIIFDDMSGDGDTNIITYLQAGYVTDEAAKEDYECEGGFWLAAETGEEILKLSKISNEEFVKKILKTKYKTEDLNKKISHLKSTLEELEKLKEYLK